MTTRVVILGAGFGGLELATRLSDDLAGEVSVTLIDKSDSFIFGYSKLAVMFGQTDLDSVRSYYRDITKASVEFRQETIASIDPVEKRVVTDGGTYDADILVVALGADLDPAATPGLDEGGWEFYTPEGADRARDAIMAFDKGAAVVGILGPFFKCPPAPFETAFLLDHLLRERGVRDATTIQVFSPLPSPIPISPDSSAAILAKCGELGIEFNPKSMVKSLDPAARTATIADGSTVPYDLFLGIPVHKAPDVVVASGLTDDGWIAVDPATFATKFADVYAVGDVTSAPVPRAGVFAEGEARTVADVLLERLGGGAKAQPYQGTASCYLEIGDGTVARVDVNFLGGPAPTGTFSPGSLEHAAEKVKFGSSRRHRWFGYSEA
jgi:sulfide:quinone oxidoreductase